MKEPHRQIFEPSPLSGGPSFREFYLCSANSKILKKLPKVYLHVVHHLYKFQENWLSRTRPRILQRKNTFSIISHRRRGEGLEILVVRSFIMSNNIPSLNQEYTQKMFRGRLTPLRGAEGCNRLRPDGNFLLRASIVSIPNFKLVSSSARWKQKSPLLLLKLPEQLSTFNCSSV